MTPEQVLARAADLVERYWGQSLDDGRWRGGHACAVVAIYDAMGGEMQHTHAGKVAIWALTAELGVEPGDTKAIFRWNDAPDQTREIVATTLRNSKRHLPEPAHA